MKTTSTFEDLLGKKEDLHPDLVKCLTDGGPLGPMIKHPLVNEIMYTPHMHAIYNKQLETKRQYIQEKIEAKEWSSAIWMHERPWRFEVFMDYMKHMTEKEYWDIFGSIWTDTENLWQFNHIIPYFLCAKGHSHLMMNEDDRELFDTLPDEIAVYRGYQTKNKKGFAWSLSLAKAQWFAQRFQQPKYNVVRGILNKKDVIALMTGRGEYEIIANHENVKQQKIVKPLKRSTELSKVLSEAIKQFVLPVRRSFHGPEHWERVEKNAIAIAKTDSNVDELVCRLFAICHDCKREHENEDPEHGRRAAKWISENLSIIPVQGERLDRLITACSYHNDGKISNDSTIGACWDADRLDLPRVGITTDEELLSTDAAKQLIWRI